MRKRLYYSADETCAASLADPARILREEPPWSKCRVEKVVEVLKRNKVSLLNLAAREGSEVLYNHPHFLRALQEERQDFERLRAEYSALKKSLQEAGLADILLKSAGVAPSFPYKSDNLDLLFRPQDIERTKFLLRSLRYVELKNVEEPHKYLFRKFHGGRCVLAVHVHGHVGWVASFLDEEVLWTRCRTSDDDLLIVHPAPEDALLITLGHFFFEDKRLSLADMTKIVHCVRQGVDWAEVERVAFWRGWLKGMQAALRFFAAREMSLFGECTVPRERLEGVGKALGRNPAAVPGGRLDFHVPFLLSKRLFYAKLFSDPSRTLSRKLKDAALHTGNGLLLRLGIHSQPRMLITISGIDGSGKTTQARLLQAAFRICRIKADYVWSRGGSARWVSLLSRLRKRKAQKADVRTADERLSDRRTLSRSPLVRWGWTWLTSVELLIRYWRRVAGPLLAGRVVICDRYVCDALADWAANFDEGRISERLAGKILRRLSPRPQRAFWLDLAPTLAVERQPENASERLLEAQAAAYLEISRDFDLQRMDASGDREGLSDEIVVQVLSDYFVNFRTLINELFLKNPAQWE